MLLLNAVKSLHRNEKKGPISDQRAGEARLFTPRQEGQPRLGPREVETRGARAIVRLSLLRPGQAAPWTPLAPGRSPSGRRR